MQDKGSTCQELVAETQEPGLGPTKLWDGSVILMSQKVGLLPLVSQVLFRWLDKELQSRGKACVTVDVLQVIVQ